MSLSLSLSLSPSLPLPSLLSVLFDSGNEFGEDGVTQLTTMAESLDCADALQSMSDDEGGDEDDDDVGDEDGEDDDTSASELQEVDTSGVVTSPDSSKASLSAISDCASPRRNVSYVGYNTTLVDNLWAIKNAYNGTYLVTGLANIGARSTDF